MAGLASNREEADSILQAMVQGVQQSVPREHWGTLCILVGGLRGAYRDEGLGEA